MVSRFVRLDKTGLCKLRFQRRYECIDTVFPGEGKLPQPGQVYRQGMERHFGTTVRFLSNMTFGDVWHDEAKKGVVAPFFTTAVVRPHWRLHGGRRLLGLAVGSLLVLR